ncbi:ABC transporter substrate-binding protein [Actinomyces minihominis]|uniref:ABC transporter substrate-binding protein n=1 Tax=Actinomyces minihominis TaxID=2002838 RepID=UPI000C07FE80|nr:ABC transporter substrate-binding protein [Actinomyces minihominis]
MSSIFSSSGTRVRHPLALLGTVAATLLVAAGCSTGAGVSGPGVVEGTGQSSLEGESIDIGTGGEGVTIGLTYVPNVQFSPVYVAATDGIFRAAGVGVTVRHHGADEGLFTALMSGDEDVTVASGDEVLQARTAGMDLVSIGAYYHDYPVVIVVREDSGIETVADLKGKSVGVPGEFGSNWFGLLAALEGADLTRSDITVVPVGFTQAASLASSSVDAIVGFTNSDVVQLEELSVPIRVIPLTDGPTPLVGASIVTTSKWLEANPKLASAVVDSITAGASRVLHNPQHALEVTTSWDPALKDPQTRAGASAVLEATLPLWRDSAGKASGLQDLETWDAMGVFLSQVLSEAIPPEEVKRTVTNDFATN